ncbi:MAG: hypothetical protein JXR25_12290 [Pontiellaceae bacterium]|nr:hypothetical protein [Pontiellaceae bacterium]MBN2785594.1 hypothetical protein [Pontiellaceae bacterium]
MAIPLALKNTCINQRHPAEFPANFFSFRLLVRVSFIAKRRSMVTIDALDDVRHVFGLGFDGVLARVNAWSFFGFSGLDIQEFCDLSEFDRWLSKKC